MTGPVLLNCDYCGHAGTYPEQIEIRNGKLCCRDIPACDARDAANNPEEDTP